MNAFRTSRGRRFLPLLAMGVVLAGSSSFVRADLLTSRLTDRPSLAPADFSGRGGSARVVFASQGTEQSLASAVEHVRPAAALAVLSLILVIPPGTQSTGTTESLIVSPPPNQQSNNGGSPPNLGTGVTSSVPPPNPTPEPGSLALALTGSGTVLLTWFRRRRNCSP